MALVLICPSPPPSLLPFVCSVLSFVGLLSDEERGEEDEDRDEDAGDGSRGVEDDNKTANGSESRSGSSSSSGSCDRLSFGDAICLYVDILCVDIDIGTDISLSFPRDSGIRLLVILIHPLSSFEMYVCVCWCVSVMSHAVADAIKMG